MALSDYVELLEHLPRIGNLLTRVLPMLESFARNKGGAAAVPVSLDDETRRAFEDLRGELGRTTNAQASLYRQLNEQGEQLSTAAAQVRAAKASVDALEARLDAMEKRQKTAVTVQLVGSLGLLVVLALLLVLVFRH